MRQQDVATDAGCTHFARAAIGGLHDPGSAASHHREATPTKFRAHLLRHGVPPMVFGEARTAKHCHARTNKVQLSKSTNEFHRNANDPPQFLKSWSWTSEHQLLGCSQRSNGEFFWSHFFDASHSVMMVDSRSADRPGWPGLAPHT